jgi:putative oxidoreductase
VVTVGREMKVMLESLILLIGRLLLASIFVHEGAFLVLHFDAAAASMMKAGIPRYLLIATVALQLLAVC